MNYVKYKLFNSELFYYLINDLSVEIYLAFGIILLLINGTISEQAFDEEGDNERTYEDKQLIVIKPTTFLFTEITIFSIITLLNFYPTGEMSINHLWLMDNLTTFLKITVFATTLLCVYISIDYFINQQIYYFEYIILYMLSLLGMCLIISSVDFISVYLAIELQSLSFYILATMKRNSEYSTEAGLKYFITGVFSSGFMLLGFAILYGVFGTTNFEQMSLLLIGVDSFAATYATMLAGTMILVAFLFKIGSVPFHTWLPDVYEGSPLPVTAFFAITPKIIVIGLIIRFFSIYLQELQDVFNLLLMFASALSMIFASIVGIFQTKIIRLFAYSAIGHSGYILIGIITNTVIGTQATLLYMLIYIIMSINLFSILLCIRRSKDEQHIKYITELANLSKSNNLLAFCFAMTLFSMAGIPPLAGFFSKLFIFFTAMNGAYYILAMIGVITSVIASVYYLYIIRVIYFDKESNWILLTNVNRLTSYIIALSTIFLLFFFIYPHPIMLVVYKISLALTY